MFNDILFAIVDIVITKSLGQPRIPNHNYTQKSITTESIGGSTRAMRVLGYSQSSVRILSYGLSDSCRSKRYTYRYSNKNPNEVSLCSRRSVYLSDRVSFFTLSQLWRHKTHHEHYH